MVISQDKEVIKVTKDAGNYISFQKLSIKSYEKQENTRKLIEKLKEVLEVKLESYNQINTILDNILESK